MPQNRRYIQKFSLLLSLALALGLFVSALSQAQVQVTDLYEVAQGNVSLTTTSETITVAGIARNDTVIQNQYIYTPYGQSKNLNHPSVVAATMNQNTDQSLLNQTRHPLDIEHNQFGYTGQANDPSTDMMMLGGFRNYAPGIDQFVQPDSYNSFSQVSIINRYAYVNDNPVSDIDPSGHFAFNWNTFNDVMGGLTVAAGVFTFDPFALAAGGTMLGQSNTTGETSQILGDVSMVLAAGGVFESLKFGIGFDSAGIAKYSFGKFDARGFPTAEGAQGIPNPRRDVGSLQGGSADELPSKIASRSTTPNESTRSSAAVNPLDLNQNPARVSDRNFRGRKLPNEALATKTSYRFIHDNFGYRKGFGFSLTSRNPFTGESRTAWMRMFEGRLTYLNPFNRGLLPEGQTYLGQWLGFGRVLLKSSRIVLGDAGIVSRIGYFAGNYVHYRQNLKKTF